MQLRPEKTVLVVDENPDVLGFLTLLLETREFRVLRARTGAEAIEILKRAVDVDVVLADMMAAGVDPPEFSHNVAVARQGLRALYMSAFVEDGVIRIVSPDSRGVLDALESELELQGRKGRAAFPA